MGTHSASLKRSHTRAYTPKQGRFGWGAITTLGPFHTFANLPGPGVRTAYFAAFGSWSGVLSKNAESLRDSDAHDARRGPAGLRDLFTFVEVAACTPCAQGLSACAKEGWYHSTLGVLRVLLKRRTAACQSGSFAVSLCPLFTFVKDPAGHCQYPH